MATPFRTAARNRKRLPDVGDDFHLDQIQNARLGTGQVLHGNSPRPIHFERC
jgi:hypothetical protein